MSGLTQYEEKAVGVLHAILDLNDTGSEYPYINAGTRLRHAARLLSKRGAAGADLSSWLIRIAEELEDGECEETMSEYKWTMPGVRARGEVVFVWEEGMKESPERCPVCGQDKPSFSWWINGAPIFTFECGYQVWQRSAFEEYTVRGSCFRAPKITDDQRARIASLEAALRAMVDTCPLCQGGPYTRNDTDWMCGYCGNIGETHATFRHAADCPWVKAKEVLGKGVTDERQT